MLRALYEYSATDSEELSFPEGAVIELIRTDDNGVDDGYWEGRYEGQVGVFPSVVVEVISNGMVSVHVCVSRSCIVVVVVAWLSCMIV